MNLSFVKTPFTNKPTMTLYDGPIFNKNPDIKYLNEKKKQLDLFGKPILSNDWILKEIL